MRTLSLRELNRAEEITGALALLEPLARAVWREAGQETARLEAWLC